MLMLCNFRLFVSGLNVGQASMYLQLASSEGIDVVREIDWIFEYSFECILYYILMEVYTLSADCLLLNEFNEQEIR